MSTLHVWVRRNIPESTERTGQDPAAAGDSVEPRYFTTTAVTIPNMPCLFSAWLGMWQ